jgi:hypothetical protein
VAKERLETDYAFGERVHIDGDRDLVAVVTGFCWRKQAHEVEVSWFCNGDLKTVWVADWRLSRVS